MPQKNIYVTQPLIPDTNDIMELLQEVVSSKWLTNMGSKHQELEKKLQTVLSVPNVSLFNNGATALLAALKALDIPHGSEVITTPFTFPATPHAISWNGLTPVFSDIEEKTMCIDPEKIEAAITEKTSAILGVHVYGFPCQVDAIEQIAQKHDLKVIYDGAHAFSTEINGKPIGSFGDFTMFSFHATKLFNTIEGGCLTYNNGDIVKKISDLRNFGIADEETVDDIGINGKLNEIQAAIGLLNLKLFKAEQEKRAKVKTLYDTHLSKVQGIKIPQMPKNTSNSYQYYPILVVEKEYGRSRDDLFNALRQINIHARKYFYPLCSDYGCYKMLPSSSKENLPIANIIKHEVLCLPFYGNLDPKAIEMICETAKTLSKNHSK